jgi:hypothetical protein
MMRGREISLNLTRRLNVYMLATVTTGLVSNVVTVTPSDVDEWSTIIALFEEYKMTGLDVHHNYNGIFGLAGTPVSTTVDNQFMLSAADPGDATAATSSGQLLQYSARQMLRTVNNQAVANGSAYSNPLQRHTNDTMWKIKLPKATIVNNSGAIIALQDTWDATNATDTVPPSYCFIKHYGLTNIVTAININSAIMVYYLHFRSRQ